jgi:hypothetical protein
MSLEAFQNIKYTQKDKTSTKNKQPSNPIHSCQVIVNDDRQINEFAGVSFSLYKRSQVKKSLAESMSKGNIEEANYWAAELACCGCFLELWETIMEFLGRNINTASPKLPVIIEKCFQNFKEVATNEYSTDQLEMRNSARVRKIIAEVVSILCISRKKSKIEYVKIDKDSDFDVLKLSSRLKASSSDFGKKVLKSEDPTEVHVAVNELCYHLSKDSRNALMAQYWVEWLLEFDKLCRKKKERCQCIRRDFAPQEDDAGLDIIFLVWDAILSEAKNRSQKALYTIISSILNLFKMRFSISVKKRRRHLIYMAINLLCEPIDLKIDPLQFQSSLKSILQNLDVIYLQVKKGEVSSSVVEEARTLIEQKKKPKTQKEIDAKHKLDILSTMGFDPSE